jgi:hypothetical protein
MEPDIEGAAEWSPIVTDNGSEWQISYRCPTCNRVQVIHVQAGNWETPIVEEDEDATGHPVNVSETTTEVERWEARRAAGEIEHELQTEFTTQLWCHSCQKGADITLIEQ